MWWKIEYESWDPFMGEEYQGDWKHHEESADKWSKVWSRFCELVQDGNVGLVTVTAMWGDHEYEPDDPFVLVYNAK